MMNLARALVIDDVSPVFDALSQVCREDKITPDSLAGVAIASQLFDLLQSGLTTKETLVPAFRLSSHNRV